MDHTVLPAITLMPAFNL